MKMDGELHASTSLDALCTNLAEGWVEPVAGLSVAMKRNVCLLGTRSGPYPRY
jgi:hypothetical protein